MVQTLTTKQMEDKVRDGQVVSENNQSDRKYKGVFFGKNFHLYRHVDVGRGYRGNLYKESGWVKAFSEVEEFSDNMAPDFVADVV
jgi:hypothetical protein